jgi:hypothetical protein
MLFNFEKLIHVITLPAIPTLTFLFTTEAQITQICTEKIKKKLCVNLKIRASVVIFFSKWELLSHYILNSSFLIKTYSPTFFALPSKKSFKRFFASGDEEDIVAISDSIIKPSVCPESTIRGKTCIKA